MDERNGLLNGDLGGVILRDFFGVSDFMSRVRREGVAGEVSPFGREGDA